MFIRIGILLVVLPSLDHIELKDIAQMMEMEKAMAQEHDLGSEGAAINNIISPR